MSPLDLCYFCNSKNLNVLRATRVLWSLGGVKTDAPDTPPLPHLLSQTNTWATSVRGRGLPSTRFSLMGAGVPDPLVGLLAGLMGAGSARGITARRAHLPGAAGLHAAARTDVPLPSGLAVCLRGDEDGGGGDGVARAAEDGQPLNSETGSTPGVGCAGPPCFLGGGA